MYEAELQNYSFPNNFYAVFGYDSAWVLASALEKTVMQLKEKNMSLDNFSYKSASIRQELRSVLLRTNLNGISVRMTLFMFL